MRDARCSTCRGRGCVGSETHSEGVRVCVVCDGAGQVCGCHGVAHARCGTPPEPRPVRVVDDELVRNGRRVRP
jgi:hypothetical protein